MQLKEKVICLFLVILVVPALLELLIRVKHLISIFIKTLFIKETEYESD